MTKVKFKSLDDCEAYIAERVAYWFDYLEERVHDAPAGDNFEIKLLYRGAKRAGSYHHRDRRLNLNVAYCMLLGNEYDETICHEVCHAVQRWLMPRSAPHGDFFVWLYNVVCKSPRGKYHNYNIKQAKALGEYLTKLVKVRALRM